MSNYLSLTLFCSQKNTGDSLQELSPVSTTFILLFHDTDADYEFSKSCYQNANCSMGNARITISSCVGISLFVVTSK